MRKHLASVALLLLGFLGATAPTFGADRDGLAEASMSFDQEGVEPFLKRVAGLVESGFAASDAKDLSGRIGSLGIEESGAWEFTVSYNGNSTRLVVEAFQDDYDAPDLYFFTSPELAARIDEELQSFGEEMGW